MKKHALPLGFWLAILGTALISSIFGAVLFGPVSLDPAQSLQILLYKLFPFMPNPPEELLQSNLTNIIWAIRFPRVLLAAAVGAGLSLCGVVMQAVVRNPLANPYVLGISSGASFGAAASILLGAFSFSGNYGTSLGAFIGALTASLLVFGIAFTGSSAGNTVRLLLAGMAISALGTALTNFLVYMAKDAEGIRNVTFWTMGSLAASSWGSLGIPSAVAVGGAVFFLTQARPLNTLLLGDESALTLGVDAPHLRKIYLVVASAITGCVVAAAGTIGFVGLVVPHVARLFVGPDHRRLLPISLLGGAIYLIWCDVGARTIMGKEEIPIGIITALIGAPFFIWLLFRRNYGFGDK